MIFKLCNKHGICPQYFLSSSNRATGGLRGSPLLPRKKDAPAPAPRPGSARNRSPSAFESGHTLPVAPLTRSNSNSSNTSGVVIGSHGAPPSPLRTLRPPSSTVSQTTLPSYASAGQSLSSQNSPVLPPRNPLVTSAAALGLGCGSGSGAGRKSPNPPLRRNDPPPAVPAMTSTGSRGTIIFVTIFSSIFLPVLARH